MLEYLKKLEPIFKDVIQQYKVNNLIKLLEHDNKQEIISFVKNVTIDTLEEDCNQFIKENLCKIDLGIDKNTLLEFMMFWEKRHNLWHIYGDEFIDYYPYYYILLDSLMECSSILSLFKQQVPFETIDREILKKTKSVYMFDKSLCEEQLQKDLKSCRDLCHFMYKQDVVPEELYLKYKLTVGTIW